jgi:hypothetical protein
MAPQRSPGERLKAFFDSTTLSVREFASEIGNPEGYRTLYNVFSGKRDPSSKLVKSIIRRFPQLSYDWVFVGAGEMLTEGGDMMRSVHDHELSVQARFEQTMDKIDKIEFSINELANRIDRGMIHQSEMTNVFFKKIDEMTSSHIQMKQTNIDLTNSIKQHDENVRKTTKKVQAALVEAEKISEVVTVNGERAEKIAKQAKEMFDSYWKSVAFAKDAYSMMKEIKEKLLSPDP